MIDILIGIVVLVVGILAINKIFGWMTSNPDEWDNDDRNNHGWWGDD